MFSVRREGLYGTTLQEATEETADEWGRLVNGKRIRMIGQQPHDCLLYSVGCRPTRRCDYVSLTLDVGQKRKLLFLVDSGADISLLKVNDWYVQQNLTHKNV